LEGAAASLRSDADFMLEAAEADATAFLHASRELHASKDFALQAAKRNGLTLQHMSTSFQADKEIATVAVAQNPAAAVFVHTSRRADLGLAMPWDPKAMEHVQVAELDSGPPPLVSLYQCGAPGAPAFHRVNKHVQYSAGSTLTANMGQGNYIAANCWLDKLPFYERPEIDSVTNMWGSVANIGMRWKAFASMDLMLQGHTDMVITVEESCKVIQAMIVCYDPPEWAYLQPFHPDAREGYLSITCGYADGNPGGGWKPSRSEDYAPPAVLAKSRDPAAVDPPSCQPAGEAKPQSQNSPLGGWPELLDTSTAQKPERLPPQSRPQTPLRFVEGARVVLVGTGRNKDGCTGVLAKKNGTGRWKVKLDDGSGNALLREEYLQLVAPVVDEIKPATKTAPVQKGAEPEGGAPRKVSAVATQPTAGAVTMARQMPARRKYHVAGTWKNWSPEEMTWDEGRQLYAFWFQFRQCGSESFYILKEGSLNYCLHPPERVNGAAGKAYAAEGPHTQQTCGSKFWTVGKDPLDDGLPGDLYEIRLSQDGGQVEWSRLEIDANETCGTTAERIVSGEGWQTAGEMERKKRREECEVRRFFVPRKMGSSRFE
jgi:hypothetical protein